jgi:hypothetical protein
VRLRGVDGDEIEMGRAAMMMIHNPKGYAFGEAGDLRKTAERLDAIADVMAGVYADRSGVEKEAVLKLMDSETWWNAEQAVAAGFADSVAKMDDEEEDEEENDDGEENEGDDVEDRAQAIEKLVATYRHAPEQVAGLLAMFRAKTEPAAPVAVAPPPPAAAASEPDQTSTRLAEIEKEQASILAATGKTTIAEAVAHIEGLKVAAAKADELATKNSALIEEKKRADVKALLDSASRSGKLSPAARANIEKPEAPAFLRDPVGLATFLDALPKVVSTTSEPTRPVDHQTDASALSSAEVAAAHASKLNPTHVAVFKSGGAAALDALLAAEKKAATK